MKEGIIKTVKEYFKYGENGEEIIISKKEYDKLNNEWEKSDPLDCGPVGYNVYEVLRLSIYTIQGIAGTLSYDMASNEFAQKNGYHPASGFKFCSGHLSNINRRKRQIKLLGEDPMDIPEGLFTKRCEKCRE